MQEHPEVKMISHSGKCPACGDEGMFSIIGLPDSGIIIACTCGYVEYKKAVEKGADNANQSTV